MIKAPLEDIVAIKDIKKIVSVASKNLTIEELSLQSQMSFNKTLKVVGLLIYSNEIKSNISVKPFGKKTEVWL